MATSAPDGYVFGITTDTLFTVNPLVYRKMPFDPWSDIVPIALLGSFSQMMVCNPAVPAKTLGELLQLAKRERLTYASGGPGGTVAPGPAFVQGSGGLGGTAEGGETLGLALE